MSKPTFTILLPVHRPPALLPYAMSSVQAQHCRSFELFVICDGAPPETVALARERAAMDPRIRVFEHPKGERNGEIYRHQALLKARGTYVCQIADDDLWLPDHLTELARLLRRVDFGHISMVWVQPNGSVNVDPHNLSDPAVRQRMLTERWNFFGPTTAGYRLSAYRSLPEGWSPAPRDIASDLFMWRKFLTRPQLTAGTRYGVTSAHFSAAYRHDWSMDQRAAEMREWAQRLSHPAGRRWFVRKGRARLEGKIRTPLSWRVVRRLRNLKRWLRGVASGR
jgi:glycosyltransferase involved in cell wall biosynthesis